MTREEIDKAEEILGMSGAMLSFNKSAPKGEIVIWNANVCVDGGKLWYGDFNLTKNKQKLIKLSKELNTKIYLLREMDGRFGNEAKPALEAAVYSTEG